MAVECEYCKTTAGVYGCKIHSPYSSQPIHEDIVTWQDLKRILGNIELKCPVCGIVFANRDYSEHRKTHPEVMK